MELLCYAARVMQRLNDAALVRCFSVDKKTYEKFIEIIQCNFYVTKPS